jgi:hypothetical protein
MGGTLLIETTPREPFSSRVEVEDGAIDCSRVGSRLEMLAVKQVIERRQSRRNSQVLRIELATSGMIGEVRVPLDAVVVRETLVRDLHVVNHGGKQYGVSREKGSLKQLGVARGVGQGFSRSDRRTRQDLLRGAGGAEQKKQAE